MTTRDEQKFLDAAQKSGRMPSDPNRKAAYKAWKKLPASSPYKSMIFEGRNYESRKGLFG